jgi:hypothetical protein
VDADDLVAVVLAAVAAAASMLNLHPLARG